MAVPKITTLAQFLESFPPGMTAVVNPLINTPTSNIMLPSLAITEITLDCDSEKCGGKRVFHFKGPPIITAQAGEWGHIYLHYICRNCFLSHKTYAIVYQSPVQGNMHGEVIKLGELPPFGPTIPARVQTLVGQSDRELFLKGSRCENYGYGIAAFAYYRRVIEDTKNRILDEIIRAAKKLGSFDELIEELQKAKAEIQFARAIENVRHALPQELMMSGLNPLTLLHRALSVGIHSLSDQECLECATSIREVLFELAEKTARITKAQTSLDAALSKLSQVK